MTTTVARAARVPLVVPAAITAAWAVAVAAQTTGHAGALHHHTLLEGGRAVWGVVLLTALAWQVHVLAVMLPSSLPLVRLFTAVSAHSGTRGAALAAFLAGYSAVWLGFGLAALAFDAVLHELLHTVPALTVGPWLPAGVLVLAGTFQFTEVKDRCLDQCRHPAAFLLPRYRRGAAAAFRLGRQHGLSCLGCCWALMLVMFAAGLVDLRWMTVLAAVMIYEKVGRRGRRLTPVVGVALLTLAGLVLAQPSWLPASLLG